MRQPIFLKANEGRHYAMGRMSALFKADGEETGGKYSISEWWLESNTTGPGAHSHDEDDVFLVIEGTMSFLIGDKWIEASTGGFVLAPTGVHDFENRSNERAGVFNISVPGNFKQNMPAIQTWFEKTPPGSTR